MWGGKKRASERSSGRASTDTKSYRCIRRFVFLAGVFTVALLISLYAATSQAYRDLRVNVLTNPRQGCDHVVQPPCLGSNGGAGGAAEVSHDPKSQSSGSISVLVTDDSPVTVENIPEIDVPRETDTANGEKTLASRKKSANKTIDLSQVASPSNSAAALKRETGSHVTAGKPRAIVVHAEYRSGSTLAGEMLRRHKQTFYTFEPINVLKHERMKPANQTAALAVLEQALACNYSALPRDKMWWWRDMMVCGFGDPVASCPKITPEDVELECRKHPISAVKVIRIERLSSLERFLVDGVFVLQLVRDPRSAMRSWAGLGHFSSNYSAMPADARVYCDAIRDDLDFISSERGRQLARNYHLVRYEDIVHDPATSIKAAFKAMRLKADEKVNGYIKEIERQKSGEQQDVKQRDVGFERRDPEKEVVKWRGSDFRRISIIQDTCQAMMTKLGYLPVPNIQAVKNNSFPTVDYHTKFMRPHFIP